MNKTQTAIKQSFLHTAMPVHLNHSLLNLVTPNQRLLRLRTTHPVEWCSVVQRFWAGTKCPLGTKLRPSYLFSHRSVFNLSLGLHDKKSESDATASPPPPPFPQVAFLKFWARIQVAQQCGSARPFIDQVQAYIKERIISII